MRKRIPLGWAILLVFLTACTQRWSPSIERLEQECGTDIQSQNAVKRFIKVLAPNGTELDTSTIYDLKASLRHEQQESTPFVSSRGCLALASEQGQIELQVLKRNWAAVEPLDSGLLPSPYRTLKLRETEPFQVQLACPTEGWAANRSMKQPLSIQSHQTPELFEIELRAVDDAGHETSLYSKKLGQKTWNLHETLDLSALDEKVYTLVAWQRDLTRQTALTASKGCTLAVFRQPPTLDGLRSEVPLVTKQGEILPWAPTQASARLHVCREPYVSTALSSPKSCTAADVCRDRTAFHPESLIRAEKAGLWQYFVYAEDPAQNTSELSCQVLIISSSAPSLQLNWRDPALRQEQEPLLREPKPILTLDIASFHQTVPQEQLNQNLECRAELLVKGLGTHAAKEVRCLSGACQGLTLEKFQSCSPELELNIANVLSEANLLDAKLRITARVHDGAGGTAEQSRDLWLRKDLWGLTNVRPPESPQDELPLFEQILDLAQGQVVASAHGKTQLWQGDRWREIAAPFAKPSRKVNFLQLEDGSLVARYRLQAGPDDPYTYEDHFALWGNEKWQALAIEGWDPKSQSCDLFHKLESSGEWSCTSLGEITRLNQNKVLESIRGREADDGGLCSYITVDEPALRNRAGIWYFACTFGLLTMDESGTLRNITFPAGPEFIAPESKEFDKDGRLWMILRTSAGHPIRIGYIEGSHFTEVPSPLATEPGYPSMTLARNARGDIQFQNFVWSDKDQAWQELEAIRKVFPNGPISVRRLKNNGLIYENASAALIEVNGKQRFFPKRGFGIFRYEATQNAIIGEDGSIWLAFPPMGNSGANVLKLKTTSFVAWGASSFNLPNESIQYFYRGPQGETVVRLVRSGFYSFRQGRWERLAENPDLVSLRTFVEGEQLWVGGSTNMLAYDEAKATWENVWQDDEYGTFSGVWIQMQNQASWRDREGRRWFVKLDGTAVTEKDGVWTALDAFGPYRDDFDESIEAVDLVDGQLVLVTRQALYFAEGTQFRRKALTEWGIEEPVLFINFLGHGFFRVVLEDKTPFKVIDARSTLAVRDMDWSQLWLPGEILWRALRDHSGRLIQVTSDRILLEKERDQWTPVLELKEMRSRLGNPALQWNSEVWLDGGSLWLTASDSLGSEVVQVLLP